MAPALSSIHRYRYHVVGEDGTCTKALYTGTGTTWWERMAHALKFYTKVQVAVLGEDCTCTELYTQVQVSRGAWLDRMASALSAMFNVVGEDGTYTKLYTQVQVSRGAWLDRMASALSAIHRHRYHVVGWHLQCSIYTGAINR